MKRLASFLLALCMAFSMAAPAFADNSNEAVIPSFSVNEPVAPEAESVPAADESTAPEAESVPVEENPPLLKLSPFLLRTNPPPLKPSLSLLRKSFRLKNSSLPKKPFRLKNLLPLRKLYPKKLHPNCWLTRVSPPLSPHPHIWKITEVDQITDGVYLIAACTGNKGTILYNVKNSNKSDQVTGDLTDNELKLASGFTENCQTWTINHKDAGFTIQGKDGDYFRKH